MLGLKRVAVLAAAGTLAAATAACGGLGVNLRGSAADTPNQVAITGTSGTTLNPYPLLVQHTVVLVAHPSAGNVTNYSVAVNVRWDSSNPVPVELLEPDCAHPYGGEFTSTICVFANTLGKTNANIDATTANGAVGTIGIAVTN